MLKDYKGHLFATTVQCGGLYDEQQPTRIIFPVKNWALCTYQIPAWEDNNDAWKRETGLYALKLPVKEVYSDSMTSDYISGHIDYITLWQEKDIKNKDKSTFTFYTWQAIVDQLAASDNSSSDEL